MTRGNDRKALRVLCVAPLAWPLAQDPSFVVETCPDHAAADQCLAQMPFDAVLAPVPATQWSGLSHAALSAAVVLVGDLAQAVRFLGVGVQDLLPHEEAVRPEVVARVLRLAVERKRIEHEARRAYATDLATGLPNHSQLIEHMSHLLALRERVPAPMALLVIRLEGLHTTESQLGRESTNVLRRKIAVRLRAGVRASDVVASLGNDAFAVLLSQIEEPEHAASVGRKLSKVLSEPFNVAGLQVAVAVALGVSIYPHDGKEADLLLRHAAGEATMSPAVGRAGFANRLEGGLAQAANDEEVAPED
ncbi:MAG TPA: GGDEF domain-containing protein [Burkholderiaceae bacterium]|nr:GGDEF domain-containing protein [Burkholderiaceae bacterium]